MLYMCQVSTNCELLMYIPDEWFVYLLHVVGTRCLEHIGVQAKSEVIDHQQEGQ